jgi:hypothetical protein
VGEPKILPRSAVGEPKIWPILAVGEPLKSSTCQSAGQTCKLASDLSVPRVGGQGRCCVLSLSNIKRHKISKHPEDGATPRASGARCLPTVSWRPWEVITEEEAGSCQPGGQRGGGGGGGLGPAALLPIVPDLLVQLNEVAEVAEGWWPLAT